MLRVKDWIKSKPQFTPTTIDKDGSILSVVRNKDGIDMHLFYNLLIGDSTNKFYIYKFFKNLVQVQFFITDKEGYHVREAVCDINDIDLFGTSGRPIVLSIKGFKIP